MSDNRSTLEAIRQAASECLELERNRIRKKCERGENEPIATSWMIQCIDSQREYLESIESMARELRENLMI
jgi:hypothetical protein